MLLYIMRCIMFTYLMLFVCIMLIFFVYVYMYFVYSAVYNSCLLNAVYCYIPCCLFV